ncbi:glutamate receptor ionotropic, kainate 2-like isoform X2 [Photinus pyralis]|uniref:glutamate receptor ionotropic, kainate 2-like isoform X2 n=1 Tax=Photinus pyralis TaxID=7054 RepID=UPI001267819A|nr:glutamate receptor ionotropic, kainate 2-like isoform X2 [Photinus pyralis]XP_031334836.1 glutamate receptor ionotropic, kainate 2-like isoform X2 [Photinus pyralis]
MTLYVFTKFKLREIFYLYIFVASNINRGGAMASYIYAGGIYESSNQQAKLAFEVVVDWISKYNPLTYDTLKILPSVIPQEQVINRTYGFVSGVNANKPISVVSNGCSLLANGIAIVFSFLTEDNANTIQSLCDHKEIPMIQIVDSSEHINDCCSISMHPSRSALSKAFADLVKLWNWKSFTILYDNADNLSKYGELLKINCKPYRNIVLRQLYRNYNGDFMDALKEIRKSGQTNFILDFSIETLAEILDQLQRIGLMTSDYSYIVLHLDLHVLNLNKYQHSAANITGFRLLNLTHPLHQKIIDVNKSKQYEAFNMEHQIPNEVALLFDAVNLTSTVINEYGLLKTKALNCKSSTSWEYGSTLFNYLKLKSFNGLSGRVEFNQYGQRTQFDLDILSLTEEGLQKIGMWDTANGLEMLRLKPDLEPTERSLRHAHFNVMVCWIQPYAMLKTTSAPLTGNDQFEGFAIDLIRELSNLEGFKYTFIRNEDDLNGSYNSTSGKWNGMIEDILSGRGDLAIGDLTITQDRQRAVDFTEPFMSLGVQILYRKPTTSAPDFFSFAAPFKPEVWVMFVVTFFVMSFMLYITARMTPSEWVNPYPCNENPQYLENTYNFQNCIWLIIANLMQEGADYGPRGLSTRILTSFWSFFILIMISTYTANMAAFLTTEKEEWAFTNVAQLVNNSEKLGIKYGAAATGATFKFFKESEDEIYKKAYEHMKNHPENLVNYFEDGVDKVVNGVENYAFFMESSSIKYVTQRRCNLTAVGKRLDEKYYAIALQKGSPFRYPLSAAVVKLKQSGVVDELERKWWERERLPEPCLVSTTTLIHHMVYL